MRRHNVATNFYRTAKFDLQEFCIKSFDSNETESQKSIECLSVPAFLPTPDASSANNLQFSNSQINLIVEL